MKMVTDLISFDEQIFDLDMLQNPDQVNHESFMLGFLLYKLFIQS